MQAAKREWAEKGEGRVGERQHARTNLTGSLCYCLYFVVTVVLPATVNVGMLQVQSYFCNWNWKAGKSYFYLVLFFSNFCRIFQFWRPAYSNDTS